MQNSFLYAKFFFLYNYDNNKKEREDSRTAQQMINGKIV